MEKGYRTLRSDLEQCMIADINLAFEAKKSLINKIKKEMEMQGVNKAQLRARQKKLIKENVTLEKMQKTQEFLSSISIFNAVIGAAGEALFSKCATLSYIFMVIAHMLNAGMISIIYPFAVFGYALMEETRPGKNFWIFMLKYTVFILFVKFACQLHIWPDLGISGTYDTVGVRFYYNLIYLLGLGIVRNQTRENNLLSINQHFTRTPRPYIHPWTNLLRKPYWSLGTKRNRS